VMPSQARLEDDAQLLAAISVGEAAIFILEQQLSIPERAAVHKAFAELDRGNAPAAREQLVHFCQQRSQVADVEASGPMGAAVQARLIADALLQHPQFFGQVE
jgi:hypothetical protein